MHVRRGSETILLVEDETAVRETIALLLKRLGYRVQEASSGEDGLRLAQGSQEKINLLITDILMPGMSGRELARALLARDTSLKVLFLSGHTGNPPSFVAFRLYYAAPARRPLQEDESPN